MDKELSDINLTPNNAEPPIRQQENESPAPTQPLLTRVNWYYVGYGIGIIVFIKYFFVYLLILSFGFSCLCMMLVYYLFSTKPQKGYQIDYERVFKKFSFTDEVNWGKETEIFQADSDILNQPIFEESFLISETFDDFLNLIIQNFVSSWYQNISKNTLFINTLKIELKKVSFNLEKRLERVDFPELLVLRILPIVTEHFNEFVKAEESVRSRASTKIFTKSNEFDFAIASNFNRGKLHPAVSLKNVQYDSCSKDYLRKRFDQILPYILSRDEIVFKPVNIIVREIVSCTVASNVLSMLSECDFYNQLIVKFIGKTLQDRTQVKQFRAALEEHSNSKKPQKSPKKKISGDYIITKTMDSSTFKKKFNNITESASLIDLKQLKYYYSIQINKLGSTNVDEAEKIYGKRLQLVKMTIDQKLAQFSNPNSSLSNESSMDSPSNSFTSASQSLTLKQVLDDSLALSYFMEFMEQRQRTVLLQFWLTVNGIKNPLEDSSIDDDDDDDEIDNYESHQEISHDKGNGNSSATLDISGGEDIKQIFNVFFRKTSLRIDDDIYKVVEDFVLARNPTVYIYIKARRGVLKLQNLVFERMSARDLSSFKKSDYFFRFLATEHLNQNPDIRGQSISRDSVTEDEEVENDLVFDEDTHENDNDGEKVSPHVVKAVEDALNEIMNTQSGSELPKSNSLLSISSESSTGLLGMSSSIGSNKKPASDLHKSLFGEGSTLFEEDGGKPGRLFDDLSDSENDTESVLTENDDSPSPSIMESGSELHLAAPGDLSLTEEISKLSEEIERLVEQQNILEPLLKKAELTNNVAELRILRKSKISLDREIQIKELQKQQYVVQENDNSLFGKSRVRIQSYINGSENGKDFVLYMIEVQKLLSDDKTIVTAGWIVARRFSQFYKLNEYLKIRYPEIATVKFPKRTVVLKFQQQQVAESRKNALEEYLQLLIKVPEICSNKVFRSFLSSENFNIEKNESFDNNIKRKSNIEIVANKLYSGLSNRLYSSPPPQSSLYTLNNGGIDEKVKEMQNELSSYDEQGRVSFVKPICNLLISIFRLNRSNSWLRGRAVLVVLQQILGTTIERKVKENIGAFRTEEKLLDIITILKDSLFPEGEFRKSSIPRNSLEKSNTKQEAKVLLETLIVEPSSRIFGSSNSKFAVNKIFTMIQNDILNKNLVYEIFDEVIIELFPEINEKL